MLQKNGRDESGRSSTEKHTSATRNDEEASKRKNPSMRQFILCEAMLPIILYETSALIEKVAEIIALEWCIYRSFKINEILFSGRTEEDDEGNTRLIVVI